MDLKPVWTHEFYIGAYDVTTKGEIKLSKLTGYIQETAWWHASHLKLGVEFLHKEKMVWMLAAIKIHIDFFPKWMDKITIESWPKGADRLYYLRDFVLYDQSGKQLGMASSQWLLLDMKSLRPKIIETDELIAVKNEGKNVFEEPIEKLPLTGEGEVLKKQVDYTDLDLNQHVNSNRYIDFILGTFDQSFHQKYNVADFQLNFIREIRGVDEILLRKKQIQNDIMYMIEGISSDNKSTYFQSFVRFA